MRRPELFGVVVAAGVVCGAGARARAVEVTTGDGIAVVDLTKDESRRVFEAVDSAAALAQLVSPALPGEYGAAVRLAAGGWQALRAALPEVVPVRLVLTAVPPAVLLLPAVGVTAAEVVQAYGRIREKAGGCAKALLAPAAEAREQLDLLGRWVEARLTREPAKRQ